MAVREVQQHKKIADYLRTLIKEGEIKAGEFLPSEAELCSKFDSSRGPVRQAIATLRAEGLVSSGRGRRSVVLGRFNSEDFDSILSISHWLESRGLDAGQKTLWTARRPAPKDAARYLRLPEGEQIVFVHRIRTTLGTPFAIERMYFPLSVGKYILDFDADSGSIHSHLFKKGIEYDNAHRLLTLVYASDEDAQALDCEPGAPLWRVQLELSDHTGRPLEYAENLFLADRIKLGMTNVRGTTSPLEVMLTD
ncbi:GntR family transcriptional regulator [Corynebacterium striatum]|uniref:GntR family transcriptional regulator n=1 Tax=Corynebacterium striatum TaxID=43770 RepID=UPI001A23A3C8|nr:GntR family transcriptional regulator [Corynebacterium striatum]GKH17682.1 GntR family transcriptional regulator [Corynebacterium striatum]HAT1242602.1 GntR family transcriptional regulator [Corynebacterium striatum]HAT1361098.1 GntR family transcriptional regulator [Corynebacterium striatum]HAT6540164.1 GntR family transcriptional regulator [Corynebacterium striatum]